MKFLETAATVSEIQRLLNGGGPVRAAVSYWSAPPKGWALTTATTLPSFVTF